MAKKGRKGRMPGKCLSPSRHVHVPCSYMNEDRYNFSLLHITAVSQKYAHVD